MPISAQQWRLAVGRSNTSRSLQPLVTGQPKMKLTSWHILIFILNALLGAILVLLSVDDGREIGERSERKCVSRGSGGGETVGELAHSLLTAPCRKELLILAGDIESNPGPYTNYIGRLRESDLELVMEEMRGVEEKWRVIGRELSGRVDNIRYPDPTDCMREVVRRWLKYGFITVWGDIIIALRKANEPQLADNLKAKYLPDLLEKSDLDLLTQELTGVKQKWYEIGVDLENHDKVNKIRRQYSDPDVCLRETLRAELQHSAPTTWRNIVDALRSSDVGQSQLADELEAKYCPKCDLLVQELSPAQQKWEDIGRELGVKQDTLSKIRTNYSDSGDCLRIMLNEWLKKHCIVWKQIIAVLRSSSVGEFHLADQLEAKCYPTSQKILEEALEKGYVDCHIWKVLVTGAAGSGKTSLKCCLFGKQLPSVHCSTALAEAAIRAISREIVGTDQDLTTWFRVTHDDLMGILSEALKAGVPMEGKKLQSKSEAAFYKWSAQVSTADDSKLSTIASSIAKSPPKPTLETTEAAVHKQSMTDPTIDDTKQSKRDCSLVSNSPMASAETVLAFPNTTAPAQVSSAKGELVQLVEKAKGSKRFLELQWIHFIDSGGQPQFHEVLPAFIRNTTSTIFVMKLSERLDEHPKIKYYDKNGQLCGKPYRHALSNDQMLQCCIQTIHSRPSTREGKHSKTLIVGTNRDRESSCSESRTKKNRKLINMLTPSLQDQLVHYRLGSEVIFPVNAKTPDEQDYQVCAMIRKQVADKRCAPSYTIPVGWFLLEQGIIKASKGGVISKSECLGIAAELNINTKALETSLQYFDDLNIFIYFPSVLPEVVFSDPQVPLNKVTELVHFSYSLHSDKGRATALLGKVTKLLHLHSSGQNERPMEALEGKWRQFRDKGIVTLDMFQDERFSAHYIPDLFTPADLIKVFQHLLIIAPLSSTEYFMPSLLQMIPSKQVSKQLPPPSSSAAPLLVHFPAGCAQHGVFCALVVHLVSKCQWKFALNSDGTPVCVSRSCIHFRLHGKPVFITLVDSFTYFQLHVEATGTMYQKFCPLIQESIFSGLKAASEALRYNNSTPVPAFICKCSLPPHAATPNDDNCYLICTQSTNTGPLTKQHRVWLDAKQHTTGLAEGDGGGSVTPSAKTQNLEHTSVEGVGTTILQAGVLQGTQAPHDQQPLSKQLCATTEQPHVTPDSPYHLTTHQHTQASGCSHESGFKPEVTSQDHQIDRPTLIECIRFRGRERRINIPQEIGVKYYQFGLLLLENDTIRSIVHKHREDPERISIEVLEEWVAGRGKHPITWQTLTQILCDIELCTLAAEIEEVKC